MTLSKNPYKGTRDFFPEMKRERDFLFKKMAQTAEQYGYEPYDGPLVEEVALYKAKSGEELINDQIYSFTDRGERFIAIRPEMTPTLARMIASVHKEVSKPIRWYSIPNLMRYERPQKGRLREHWQFNCDIFGATGFDGEIEILQVAISLMENYGANDSHFEILINDRNIVDGLFNKILKLNGETSQKLYKVIDKAKKISDEELEKMISELNLEDSQTQTIRQYLNCQNPEDIGTFLESLGLNDEMVSFQNFVKQTTEIGVSDYLKYDPTIVRGLDYYTGIVFEIFDKNPENRRAICGGGAYAELLKIFNEKPLSGVGFGLGDVTLKDFLKTHDLLRNFDIPENDILVSFQIEDAKSKALFLARNLRNKKLKVFSTFEKTKYNKAINLAKKKGSSFIAIFGEDELNKNEVQIKSLKSTDSKTFSIDDTDQIAQFLRQSKWQKS